MSEQFLEDLNKLIRIIHLSIDISEEQKHEWIEMIESFKNYNSFNLNILINEITNININEYNKFFQKKVNKLSKDNIIKYNILALEYINNKNIDNTLAFLENYNANIQEIEHYNKIEKLKMKSGLLYKRQRSLKLSKIILLKNNLLKKTKANDKQKN